MSSKVSLSSLRRRIQIIKAKGWNRVYIGQYKLKRFLTRYGVVAVSLTLILVFLTLLPLLPQIQTKLEPHLADQHVDDVRALILAVGTALVGATAIAFSLVMFAIQTNVERLPHGMFQTIVSDFRILGVFAGTLVLSLVFATSSIAVSKSRIALVVWIDLLLVLLIFILFVIAYRRALELINPKRQAAIVALRIRREFAKWDRRAKRALPLYAPRDTPELESARNMGSVLDLPRTAYLTRHHYWTRSAIAGIEMLFSFARRFAQSGDHEVSMAALTAVTVINQDYVITKGSTFFTDNLLMPSSHASDGFISHTLEQLRQFGQEGFARRDEQQALIAIRTIAALVPIYLTIQYSTKRAPKTHARLAAGYLPDQAKAALTHNFIDVAMEATRQMWRSALFLLANGSPDETASLIDHIATIAAAGLNGNSRRPLLLTGTQQLASLTFELLRSNQSEIRFPSLRLRTAVSALVKQYLAIPDTSPFGEGRTYLGPYYSATDPNALTGRLSTLANSVADADSDNDDAKRIIRNFVRWSDGLYQVEREHLKLASTSQSQFTFDLLLWICTSSTVLLLLSHTKACDGDQSKLLRRSALWLFSSLTFISTDGETVDFLGGFSIVDELFDVCLYAKDWADQKTFDGFVDVLTWWGFEAGFLDTKWSILSNSLEALAVLSLIKDRSCTGPRIDEIAVACRAKCPLGTQHALVSAAQELRSLALKPDRGEFAVSAVDAASSGVEKDALRQSLNRLANLLSPATANEPPDEDVIH